MKPSILLVTKEGDTYAQAAADFLTKNFDDCTILAGTRAQKFPEEGHQWEGDYIISYLSPWIIGEEVLQKARAAAINFHPGPPQYPGIGCTNFAIYDGVDGFGITCHHMARKVDTGQIIAVKRFRIYETDSVLTLTRRCYGHILALFYDIASLILDGEPLPESEETWTRKPYTRKELNALGRITADMTDAEVRRRIRAMLYPDAPGAYIEIAGARFDYSGGNGS